MSEIIEPIARLSNELGRLPGIGRKTAQRLAFHIVSLDEERVRELAVAIFNAKKQTCFCSICGNLATEDPCSMCRDDDRKNGILCVVKDPRDVMAMERMRDFHGMYHVLHGVISPMQGIGPDDIRIPALMERLKSGQFHEVVLATNPDIEGEATASYIARLIKPLGIRVTRIAHGIPVGADLEYTDEVTLSKAFSGRSDM